MTSRDKAVEAACPWHGDNTELDVNDNGNGCFWVVCNKSGCGCEGPYAQSEAEAWEKWNCRAASAAEGGEAVAWRGRSHGMAWEFSSKDPRPYNVFDEVEPLFPSPQRELEERDAAFWRAACSRAEEREERLKEACEQEAGRRHHIEQLLAEHHEKLCCAAPEQSQGDVK